MLFLQLCTANELPGTTVALMEVVIQHLLIEHVDYALDLGLQSIPIAESKSPPQVLTTWTLLLRVGSSTISSRLLFIRVPRERSRVFMLVYHTYKIHWKFKCPYKFKYTWWISRNCQVPNLMTEMAARQRNSLTDSGNLSVFGLI